MSVLFMTSNEESVKEAELSRDAFSMCESKIVRDDVEPIENIEEMGP
jgi:hypothetical protein